MPANRSHYPLITEGTFSKLDELCANHPEIFRMDASPDSAQSLAFYQEFVGTAYVRGLLSNPRLQHAIDALEGEYIAVIDQLRSELPVLAVEGDQHTNRPLERKIRFMQRVAALIKYSKESIIVTNPARKRDNRLEVARLLKKIDPKLHLLLHDDFFKESLQSDRQFDLLMRMREVLPDLIVALKTKDPHYVIIRERDSDHARARQLVNRLADACYRIYGCCGPSTIEHLISYDWLEFVSGISDLPAIICETADRKVSRFEQRLPNEDYIYADLSGEWAPARTLTPPWMDFSPR